MEALRAGCRTLPVGATSCGRGFVVDSTGRAPRGRAARSRRLVPPAARCEPVDALQRSQRARRGDLSNAFPRSAARAAREGGRSLGRVAQQPPRRCLNVDRLKTEAWDLPLRIWLR